MGRLDGKVAFISGGARGMGAEEARLFAREGAKVAIGDVLDEEGRGVEAEINESGGDCLFIHLDVTSEANWQDAIAQTVSRFGALHILCEQRRYWRCRKPDRRHPCRRLGSRNGHQRQGCLPGHEGSHP